jgi:hypothetical protein
MNSDGTPWPRMFVSTVAVDLVDREFALSLILDSQLDQVFRTRSMLLGPVSVLGSSAAFSVRS